MADHIPLSGEAGPEKRGGETSGALLRSDVYIPSILVQQNKECKITFMAEKLKIISLAVSTRSARTPVYEYGGDIVVGGAWASRTTEVRHRRGHPRLYLSHQKPGQDPEVSSSPMVTRTTMVFIPISCGVSTLYLRHPGMTAGLVKLKLEEHRLLTRQAHHL